MMPPLSFSDDQLELVTRAAALVSPHDRGHFLRSVANRLDTANPTDSDIRDAIDFVLGCRGVAGGNQAFIQPKINNKAKGIFR
jgi:hypothetical protein